MDKVRVLFAVVTLLLTLAMFGIVVWGFMIPHWGMVLVGLLLTVGFSFFCYHDYMFFFGNKKTSEVKDSETKE